MFQIFWKIPLWTGFSEWWKCNSGHKCLCLTAGWKVLHGWCKGLWKVAWKTVLHITWQRPLFKNCKETFIEVSCFYVFSHYLLISPRSIVICDIIIAETHDSMCYLIDRSRPMSNCRRIGRTECSAMRYTVAQEGGRRNNVHSVSSSANTRAAAAADAVDASSCAVQCSMRFDGRWIRAAATVGR